MANKQNAMIQLLSEQNRRLNAAQVAAQLGTSVRTVHNYIKELNERWPGMITSTEQGYEISLSLARSALKQDDTAVPQTAEDRCGYILNRLVQVGKPVDIYDLCSEIYISATTFQSLVGKMRRIAKDYDLTLNISGSSVSLSGYERNKRKLLSGLLYYESASKFTSVEALQAAFPSIDIGAIRTVVLQVLTEYRYYINDYSLVNLLLHLTIAIDRVKNGCVSADPVTVPPLKAAEIELANCVIDRLQNYFDISFSPAESYEIALLLISRASALDYASITVENISSYIGADTLELVQQLLKAVKEIYDINLDDRDFFVRFSLHIHNLIVRASAESLCKNPMTADIRQNCPLIYDVSVMLASIIRDRTGIVLNEDEIAYIALHLGGALEIQKELANRISTVLYCPSYYNMDTSLSERLLHRLEGKIVLSDVVTTEAGLAAVTPGALVIATVRPYRIPDLPLVLVSPFLTNTDILAINRKIDEIRRTAKQKQFRGYLNRIMNPALFEIDTALHTKDEVIRHLCGRLTDEGYANLTFREEILQREEISPTAFGQFAIPHTLKMHGLRTGIAVYLNRQGIAWGGETVNLVMMLCFNPNDKKMFYELFEPLSMVMLEPAVMKNLLACKDYLSFVNLLTDNLE